MKKSFALLISIIIAFLFCTAGAAYQTYYVEKEIKYGIEEVRSGAMETSCGNTEEIIKKSAPEIIETKETKEPVMYYTPEEVAMIAKLLYRECRGVPSDTEKACVAWTVCNRVDAGYAGTISEVITAQNQFAYIEDTPVDEKLYALAEDVLARWNNERNGNVSVGRILPTDYLWFSGDGRHNYFRNQYSGGNIWDYSLESPYES